MANTIKRMLSMLMVLCVLVCALPLQALAAEDGTTTEVVDGVEITTTQTTTTTTDGNTTTITVTVEKDSNGVKDSTGEKIEGTETTVTTTVTDANGNVIDSDYVVDGYEKKEWTEEDTGDTAGQPEVSVTLVPGQSNVGTATGDPVVKGDTTTTVTDRTVTADVSEENTTVAITKSELDALQSELKFDRNDAKDQAAKKKETDLYTDNGHFVNPDSITVTDAPEDHPFQYIGHGDYSGHYISHIRIIYDRNEDGTPKVDENGNYIIKELQHNNGTVLTKNGVPTTDLNGPYDQTTGTRGQQFVLKNEEGDVVYGYCIDLDTGAEKSTYYQVANLEDNTYYASEESEMHVRNIVTNGYWGTAEGTGSLSKIKEDMKAAVAAGTVEKEYDITFVIRGAKYTEGYELKEGEYVGNGYICRQVTEHIVLTDEVIDAFTEGEALDATQSAIWSFANGSKLALDGTDRMIVGDITYASSALGDSLNKQNDYAGAARTLAFYNYLVSLEEDLSSTVVINDKNNVNDMNLVIGDKVAGLAENEDDDVDNDVYTAEMNFTLAFTPDPKNDDLLVHITYMQNGEEVTVIKRLAGENSEGRAHDTITPDADGVYTLTGLQLSENEELTFDLRLEGTQYLENGVYIYTAQGGYDKSQSFVGMAEGTNSVDVSKSVTIKFDVDENNHVVAERKWHDEKDPSNEPEEEEETPPPVDYRVIINDDGLEEIPEEPVPLASAPKTGDNSGLWILLVMAAAFGIVMLNINTKKRNSASF